MAINLNRESSFEGIVKHRVVFFNLFEISSETKENRFHEMLLGRSLKMYLDNNDYSDYEKNKLIELFSIANLEKQNMIVLNNDSGTFTLNQTFYDLFSYLNEDRYYKLNNHSLKKFTNTMKNLKKEISELDFNDKYSTENFVDILMQEFESIRQELEKHVRVLESKVNNLISILEKNNDKEYLNNRELANETYQINYYFIEPLREFLKNDSSVDLRNKGLGITSCVKYIRDKMSKEGFSKEAKEITAFSLNFFKSYLSRAEVMSSLLSRYVSKSIEDIKIHSNIEKLFLLLEDKMEEISHGKAANKYLKSTDLLKKVDFLPGLKSKENFSVIDYESELEIIDIQWENINNELDEISGIKKPISTFERVLSDKDIEAIKEDNLIIKYNEIISKCKKEILEYNLDENSDVFLISHNLLKTKIEDYKLFYTLLLVYSLEEEFKFNINKKEKLFINYNGEQLVYSKKTIMENIK